MSEIINLLLRQAEAEYPVFYDNFRRTTSIYRDATVGSNAQTFVTASVKSNRAEIFVAEPRAAASNAPTKITRLRRGPRWIPTN